MYGKVFFKNYYYYEFVCLFEKKKYGTSTCSYLKSLFQEICKIIFKIFFDNPIISPYKPEVVNWNFNLHNTKNRVHLYRSLQIVRVKKNSFTEYLSDFSPRSVTRYTEGRHTYDGTFPLDIYIGHLTLFCISDKNIPINPSYFFIMYCRMKR